MIKAIYGVAHFSLSPALWPIKGIIYTCKPQTCIIGYNVSLQVIYMHQQNAIQREFPLQKPSKGDLSWTVIPPSLLFPPPYFTASPLTSKALTT